MASRKFSSGMRTTHTEEESQALFGFFVGPTQLPLLTSDRSYSTSPVILTAEIIVIETAMTVSAKASTLLPSPILWRVTVARITFSAIRFILCRDALPPSLPHNNVPEHRVVENFLFSRATLRGYSFLMPSKWARVSPVAGSSPAASIQIEADKKPKALAFAPSLDHDAIPPACPGN